MIWAIVIPRLRRFHGQHSLHEDPPHPQHQQEHQEEEEREEEEGARVEMEEEQYEVALAQKRATKRPEQQQQHYPHYPLLPIWQLGGRRITQPLRCVWNLQHVHQKAQGHGLHACAAFFPVPFSPPPCLLRRLLHLFDLLLFAVVP